jgi:hypothetical protein
MPARDNLERALASAGRVRLAFLQNARHVGTARASCNALISLGAYQRQRQNTLISLD